jgi:hypothetical protein
MLLRYVSSEADRHIEDDFLPIRGAPADLLRSDWVHQHSREKRPQRVSHPHFRRLHIRPIVDRFASRDRVLNMKA